MPLLISLLVLSLALVKNNERRNNYRFDHDRSDSSVLDLFHRQHGLHLQPDERRQAVLRAKRKQHKRFKSNRENQSDSFDFFHFFRYFRHSTCARLLSNSRGRRRPISLQFLVVDKFDLLGSVNRGPGSTSSRWLR